MPVLVPTHLPSVMLLGDVRPRYQEAHVQIWQPWWRFPCLRTDAAGGGRRPGEAVTRTAPNSPAGQWAQALPLRSWEQDLVQTLSKQPGQHCKCISRQDSLASQRGNGVTGVVRARSTISYREFCLFAFGFSRWFLIRGQP